MSYEVIELAEFNLRLSVAPFAAAESAPDLPVLAVLPPGNYRMVGGLLCKSAPADGAQVPELVATVTFLPTAEGGRRGPPPREHWRCTLRTEAGNVDARLSFNPESSVDPGSNATARIQLLSPDLLARYFPLGTDFELWEGKAVGRGRVFMHILQ